MRRRRVGNSGLAVSRLGLGTMLWGGVADEDVCRELLVTYLEAGGTLLDTAHSYAEGRSEEIVGALLREVARRDAVTICTKAGITRTPEHRLVDTSRGGLLRHLDDSLHRLGTDYVDLYQIHRWDYGTPIEETLEALHETVKAGKVRYIGASSMFAWQFSKSLYVARGRGWTPFATMQNHYNLLYREEEREMLPLCAAEGIGVIPWSPLARGRLTRDADETTARVQTDEYGRSLYEAQVASDRRVIDAVAALAARRGVPRAQIALAWLFHKPVVTSPIVGASKIAHLDDAVAAMALKLSADEIASLEQAYVPHPIAGFE